MITEIVLRKEATFDGTGCCFADLKPINIIYGANGTGKTTMSRVLSSPESFPSCSVKWNLGEQIPILVYNRDFCEANFSELNNIDGVYTLGEDNVEGQKQLAEKHKELKDLKENLQQNKKRLSSINDSLEKLRKTFGDTCWLNILQSKNYSRFTKLFEGGRGSKSRFAEIVISHHSNYKSPTLSFDELTKLYDELFAQEQSSYSLISFTIPNFCDIERNIIWRTPIIGKSDVDIANLIKKYNISDWVRSGKQIIHDNSLEICPFCQRQLDDHFINQLNELFDDRFNEQIKELINLQELYKSHTHSFQMMYESVLKQESIDKYLDTSKFKDIYNSILKIHNRNLNLIESKIKEPSTKLQIEDCEDLMKELATLIGNANEKIVQHNKAILNIKLERQNILSELWSLIISEHSNTIENYLNSQDRLIKRQEVINDQINSDNESIVKCECEIQKLNSSMTDIQSSIDEINRVLKFFNFSNFQLVRKDNHKYTIKRDSGEDVNNSLSEGEKTFVTFLYFMQLIKGGITAERTNEDKIVVIDDPVSSLDSNILYVVSSLIKDLIENIKQNNSLVKQVFILTHNVFFHHDVSHGCTKRNANGKYAFWILNRVNVCSHATFYGSENPIKSSYSLLWHELRRAKESNVDCGTAQNIMRRIYEHYFQFIGFYSDEDIINEFETDGERKICRALICYINDGSHIIADDLYYIPNKVSLQAYLNVFERIFEKTHNKEHFDMMWNNS